MPKDTQHSDRKINKNMDLEKAYGTINSEYTAMIRKEIDWVYNKLDSIDKRRMEKTLIEINQLMVTTLTTVISQKQIIKESQQFAEIVNLFKISPN